MVKDLHPLLRSVVQSKSCHAISPFCDQNVKKPSGAIFQSTKILSDLTCFTLWKFPPVVNL